LLDSPDFADEPAGFKERRHRVVFLPGSRKQEVIKHIPLIDSIAVSLSHRDSTIEIAIAKSKSVSADIYKEAIAGHKNLRNVTLDENSRELMRTSKAGIVKTGTSTLEAALCGIFP
jgi:lipid-A-disaccharide synthase